MNELVYKGWFRHPYNPTFNREYCVWKTTDGTLSWELTQGLYAEVDMLDLDLLLNYTWRAQKSSMTYYALGGATNSSVDVIGMHRVIATGIPQEIHVDHKNRDGLCNLRNNLRLSTEKQNMFNHKRCGGNVNSQSSKYRGVTKRTDNNRFRVRTVDLDNSQVNVGHFDCEIEAAIAWDEWMYERYKNDNPLLGLDFNGVISEPTVNFIEFNFPERLGL